MNKRRPVLTYSNVIATCALVLSLTGTALATGMIGGAQVRDQSLTGKDVKNSSLSGVDIKAKSIPLLDLASQPGARAYAMVNVLAGPDPILVPKYNHNFKSVTRFRPGGYCVYPKVSSGVSPKKYPAVVSIEGYHTVGYNNTAQVGHFVECGGTGYSVDISSGEVNSVPNDKASFTIIVG